MDDDPRRDSEIRGRMSRGELERKREKRWSRRMGSRSLVYVCIGRHLGLVEKAKKGEQGAQNEAMGTVRRCIATGNRVEEVRWARGETTMMTKGGCGGSEEV